MYLAGSRRMYDTGEWGMIMSIDNSTYLRGERANHNTADKLGKQECQMCGFCCLRKPCVPTPDEMEAIANHLGTTTKQLAHRYMVIDGDENELHLVFAQETQIDLLGKQLPYYRTYDRGYCIMFDRETHKCKVHEVSINSKNACHCWKELDDDFDPRTIWKLEDIQKFIPSFKRKHKNMEVL